jgi:hypothetical protein
MQRDSSQRPNSPARPPFRRPARGATLTFVCLALAGLLARALVGAEPAEEVLPIFQVNGATLGETIRLLAKTGGLNTMIDPRLNDPARFKDGSLPLARAVTVKYENRTARQVLEAVLGQHDLRLVWNPESTVARIALKETEAESAQSARLRAEPLPKTLGSTNVLAQIVEEETPWLEAFANLVRETGLNIALDPVLAGRAAAAGSAAPVLPKVEYRLSNLTALQALAALVENSALVLVWNPATLVGRVVTRETRLRELDHPLAGLKPMPPSAAASKVQPSVFIDEAPLGDLIALLASQLGANIWVDPDVAAAFRGAPGAPAVPATAEAKFKNVSLHQAFLALLDLNGLALVWDPETSVGRVLTRDQAWDELEAAGRNPSPLPAHVGRADVEPEIRLRDTPLGTALRTLARLAEINLLLCPELLSASPPDGAKPVGELPVEVSLDRVTARQALLLIIAHHHLAVAWDAETGVGYVAPRQRLQRAGGSGLQSSAALAKLPPGAAGAKTFRWDDQPVREALGELAGELGLKIELDPKLEGGLPGPDGKGARWPLVNARLDKITAGQALAALLAAHGLTASYDPASKTAKISAP